MSPPGRKPPASGRREHVGLRLSPAEAAEVRAALLPGEPLAVGVRRIVLAAVRASTFPASQ